MKPDFIQKLERARQLIQGNQLAPGLALYAQLFREFPQCGGEYGRAAAYTGDYELAVQVWEKTRSLDPGNVDYVLWLAAEYAKLGLHAKSKAALSKAANLAPRHPDVRLKQAWLLTRTAGVEEARAAVGKYLALEPGNQSALYLSACLDRRENKLDSAERQLRDLVAAGVTLPHVRYACRAELAHILDRTGRFEEAMGQLQEAKDEARKTRDSQGSDGIRFERREKEIQQAKSLPVNILETWAETFAPGARSTAPPLVFLTGSARSGTTLLERILDAHPSVAACDEVLAFQKIQRWVALDSPTIPTQQLNAWRERYVKSLLVDLGPAAKNKTLLDKNPSYTFWLPAFLRVFPELHVLIGLRDPRDVMVSLYFQDHPYTNPLTMEELAQYYSDVLDLWLIVREWKGLAWMETRYEDTVADVQKEGRRVTEFIGLPWHENQARYHEKNREKPILSNNFCDVTKPVYTRSVGRWQAYEKYLASILPVLEPYCKKFGYW